MSHIDKTFLLVDLSQLHEPFHSSPSIFFSRKSKAMGLAISRMVKMLFAKREMRILMVGLDAAGKTTILYKLKLGEIITTIPTIGTFPL